MRVVQFKNEGGNTELLTAPHMHYWEQMLSDWESLHLVSLQMSYFIDTVLIH